MAAPTKSCYVKIPLANPEPSTHGTTRTCRNVWYLAVFRGKADISQRLPKISIYEFRVLDRFIDQVFARPF
jgi:hypothetical protein